MNVLGRYGDALNPWGDILTVARAWCVSSPQAKVLSTYEYLSVYPSIYSNSGKSMVCFLSTS